MMHWKESSVGLAVMLMAMLVAGCGEPSPAPKPTEQQSVFAPNDSASRLQDLAGSMLLFQGAYGRLPNDLEELRLATGLRPEQIVDPVTGRPFAYSPAGVAASSEGRTIVAMAAPPPGGEACYGISVSRTPGGILTDIVPFPAEAYRTMQTRPAAPAPAPAPAAPAPAPAAP